MGKEIDLAKINSMTKYPSILTYHKMGEREKLLDEIQVPFDKPAILTEKVNGVNGRVILFPDGFYIIGSREELLYAKGDLIRNPQLGIVETLTPIAEDIPLSEKIMVYYFEVYGGKTTKNGKQYTGTGLLGARLFDVARIPNSDEILKMPIEKIASWRDNGAGPYFYDEDILRVLSNLCSVPLTPRISEESSLPTGLKDTHDWLKTKISMTQAALDDSGNGKPEGIVIRSFDRSKIAKLRFEDYERTLRGKRYETN